MTVGEAPERQRVDEPCCPCVSLRGHEPGDVTVQQQVVIVEKRDPVAGCRVEPRVGRLRPRQARVAFHESQ
jgi:hypothetical protein